MSCEGCDREIELAFCQSCFRDAISVNEPMPGRDEREILIRAVARYERLYGRHEKLRGNIAVTAQSIPDGPVYDSIRDLLLKALQIDAEAK